MSGAADWRVIEYTCRHRDFISKPLYSDWRGTLVRCAVCDQHRKIVWTDEDDR